MTVRRLSVKDVSLFYTVVAALSMRPIAAKSGRGCAITKTCPMAETQDTCLSLVTRVAPRGAIAHALERVQGTSLLPHRSRPRREQVKKYEKHGWFIPTCL